MSDYCNICGDELFGESHYHCGYCESPETTGMMGHYTRIANVDGRMYLLPEHRFECEEGFQAWAEECVANKTAKPFFKK